MRIPFLMFLFSSILTAKAQTSLSLMPVPKNIELVAGRFQMSSGFTVSVKADKTDTILYRAANRMYRALNRRTGLFFLQEDISPKNNSDKSSLIITVKQKTRMAIGVDESYEFQIINGQLRLDANTTIGALRGMETILQLESVDESGVYMHAVKIKDAPRFAWRGLMIDVARHFIPLDVLKRNIDAMAAVKMNVLHLHLSDDQGFRVESRVFPRLQSMGSNGDYYTQVQIRELVSYALDRGILIVPEFDMPGHTTSWFAGYPELATKPGPYKPGSPYKLDRSEPLNPMKLMQVIQTTPFPCMNPVKESVYVFLDKFIGEMSALFPAPYFHIGADENNGVAWKQDSAIAQFMKKNNLANTHEMQAWFVEKVRRLVTKRGKKMIGWDELFSKNLSKDVIVQVWTPMSAPGLSGQIAAHGNPVIISKGLYLDHFLPAYIHYQLDLPSEGILGGEAAQWTEIADAENIETRIWPRAAAVAERFWSPKTVRDSADMYRRLFILNDRLSESGLMQISNYDRMVRRFAGVYNYQAVSTLMDVLTPVKGYKKLFALISMPESAYYPTTPLIRASDIARVDSRQKWEFRTQVADYLMTKSPGSEQAIRDQLLVWSVNYDQLKPLFKSSRLAKEIEDQSKNLSALSQACLITMDQLKSGKELSAQWIANTQELLDSARSSKGDVELSVLPELKALITKQLPGLPGSYPLF